MALYLGNERITPNLTTTVSGVIPSGTKNITDTSLTDVSLFQYAQVSDGNLVAENIKKDVSILGITGTLEETTPVSGTLQITSNGTFDVSDKQYAEVNVAARLSNPKTVTPSATSQTVLPDQGDDGLSQVTVSGDSNLVAGNMKKDVSIFGVTGTLESSSGGSGGSAKLLNLISRDKDFSLTADDLAGLTQIGEYALYSCFNLKSVVIPDSVTRICYCGFQNCNGLTSVTIPNSVTSIDDYAFQNCNTLPTIVVPDSVTNISWYAFNKCIKLTSMTLPFVGRSKTTSNGYEKVFGYIFGYVKTSSQTDREGIYQYDEGGIYYHYKIPNSIESVAITGGNISNNAFYNCSHIKDITFPSGITELGSHAFYNCTSLATTNHGNDAWGPFDTVFTLPETLNTIKDNCFYSCSSLKYIDFNSSNVDRIPDNCFYGCTSLDIIGNTNNIKYIGNSAFRNTAMPQAPLNTSMPSLISIGQSAFMNCDKITYITLPATLTSIGSSAFYGCKAVTSIECHMTTPPSIDNFTFDSSIASNAGFVITVPAGSGNAYKAATGWSQFTDKIVESTEF